jgi:class 3 adenylate cyclase/tetratricopeptide (TPR) repeat protein
VATCLACGEENPDRAKFCMSCGAPVAVPPRREARKTVTVIFTDLSGSTAMGEKLDAESVVRVLGAYFDTMREVLERHGATVAKFIGDAIMAVFGLPQVHEDDALRAVRAVVEMRRALVAFNVGLEREYGVQIAIRTGVYTGEVFAGEEDIGSSLALGDPVNTAARLEQAAGRNEILLGHDTFRLVRDAVVVEPVEPVPAKGKAEPVKAWRLLDVSLRSPGRSRRMDTPLVGRDTELAVVLDRFAAAARDRTCRTVGVLGEAGVGKSRLMAELARHLSGEALVVTGRCLSYGAGITYWPLAEIVRYAAGVGEADDGPTAEAKIAAVVAGVPDGGRVAERVTEVLGLTPPSGGAEEVPWALRRFVEALSRDRPLVLVIDDVQWAEAGLVDVLEDLARRVTTAVLLLCVARPDLTEVHPDFVERTGAELLRLERLEGDQAASLLEVLVGPGGLPGDVGARILEAAEGNPLFVEELLGMLVDEGQLSFESGRWVVVGEVADIAMPPSISAVLTARLDRLPSPERTVVESASVVGQEFELSAVTTLVPDELRLPLSGHLSALERRELVLTADPTPLDAHAYRFQHLLVRDAAYEGMAKAARASTHEGAAGWLASAAGARISEYEAIVGYHLEQAYRLKAELGPTTPADEELARRAVESLARAGRRALAAEDFAGAETLLGRAADLTPAGAERVELLLALGEAVLGRGDLGRVDTIATEARRDAERLGDDRLRAHAVVALSHVRRWTGAADAPATEDLERAVSVFAAHGDERGLALAWLDLAQPDWAQGRVERAEGMARRALDHARRAEDRTTVARLLGNLGLSAVVGPQPTSVAVGICEEYAREVGGSRVIEARLGQCTAQLSAMRGDVDAARALLARCRATYAELGKPDEEAILGVDLALVERLAGDDAAAERELRACYDVLERIGEQWVLSTVAGELVHLLVARGEQDEAARYLAVAEEAAGEEDLVTLLLVQRGRARLLARAGRLDEAEGWARRAVARAATTEWSNDRAGALTDLGEVLRLQGDDQGAAMAFAEALTLYDAKENLVEAERLRRRSETAS